MRHQPTSLLQIFCEFMVNYGVISISIIGPDDSCWGVKGLVSEGHVLMHTNGC